MTTWRPLSSSPNAASPPAAFDADDSADGRLVRIGPSLHGWVYRAAEGHAIYRVLPIDTLPVPWRQAVRERAGEKNERHGTDGVLYPMRVGQHGDIYFLIRYEPNEPVFSLAELLAGVTRPPNMLTERLFRAAVRFWEERGALDRQMRGLVAALTHDSPALRVVAVGWAIQAVAEWRRHSIPVMPMPADIVFDQAGRPFHLWTLNQNPGTQQVLIPDAEQMLAEPERILYLPPELMGARGAAGWAADGWYRADWYSLGVMLLQCFYRVAPPAAAESALARAASGTLFSAGRRYGMTPAWLASVPASKEVLAWAAKLTDPDPARRPPVDPQRFGDVIEAFGLRLTPAAAVEELRAEDRPLDGLSLVRTLMLAGETYDNLVLAGDLAASAGHALEALDFLGRAIAIDPARPDGRVQRLLLVANAGSHPELIDMAGREGPRLDVLIWDDFNALDAEGQQYMQLSLARYLVWRGLYESAATHVYRWLFNEDGSYRWLYLGMNLVYADVLYHFARKAVEGGEPDAPARVWALRDHLELCKSAIKEVRRGGALESGEIYKYGTHLDGVSNGCHELEQRVPRRPAPPPTATPTPTPAPAPAADPMDAIPRFLGEVTGGDSPAPPPDAPPPAPPTPELPSNPPEERGS